MTYHWICNRVSRRMSLVEHELLTLPEHLISLPISSGVHVAPSFFNLLCIVLYITVFPFVPFILVTVLPSFFDLRLTPAFGILYFFWKKCKIASSLTNYHCINFLIFKCGLYEV